MTDTEQRVERKEARRDSGCQEERDRKAREGSEQQGREDGAGRLGLRAGE